MPQLTLYAANMIEKLHTSRLLPIEERPVKRLISKIVGHQTPHQKFLTHISTPTNGDDGTDSNGDSGDFDSAAFLKSVEMFRDTVNYEFDLFESNLARIQLLRTANDLERSRYAAEKLDIEGKADDVRENISSLRTQLEQAQQTLAVRKNYDVLADKITKNPNLKPRDEQHVNIEKLKSEIEELQRESQELSQTWIDRRQQFTKVLDEGHRLRRQIRNEKEPGEGDADDEDQDEDMDGVDRNRSNVGTPRPGEDAPTPLPGERSRATTPGIEGVATPQPELTITDTSVGDTSQKPIDEMDIS
jgi:hypothetical protein